MDNVIGAVDAIAGETKFSGVVRIDRDGSILFARAYGAADRSSDVANTVGTRFGIASGTKGFTALTVVSLIADGTLAMDTTARSLLGHDLPLIDDAVTIEQLLAHRSGIGDYLDENVDLDVNDYLMSVPVHELDGTEAYLRVLDGFPTKFAAGEQFAYCNGGYVVLALLAQRATAIRFEELVRQRVCAPAGLHDTEFLRADEFPGGAARGYLHADGLRTNVLHLPLVGSGDGGISTTADDVHTLWQAFLAGGIVSRPSVEEMIRPHSDAPAQSSRYGLGFWLHEERDVVMLEGCDAGVSFRTVNDPARGVVYSVLSNTSDGAWPVVRCLDELLIG